MASKDGRIQDFVPRGKKRPNPVMLHDENKNDHHADDSNDCQQQQQKTQQQEQVPPEALLPSSTGCLVCGVDDDHAKLLLCEDCNGEFHTYCLTPKLDTVPEYDWFCERCRPESGDRLEERVCALPPSYTSRFGEICWGQGGVGYGWWPACIYDPRMTMGSARNQALKHLGKRYLVFFFQCSDTPSFEILTMNKIVSWEQGLAESFHLGKTARASGKMRHGQFRKALQEAAIEESLPKERRLDWNHQGGAAVAEGGAGAAGGSSLPCPKKVRRGRKRRRVENTTSGNIRAPPAATKTNSKNNSVGGETAGPPAFGRVVEKKAARRNLSFTAPTLQQNPPPAGQSTSTGNTGTSQDDVVHSTKSKSAANVNTSSGGRGIPVEQQRQPAAAAATAIAAIVPTAAQDESADGEMYCKVQREVRLKASAADDSSSTSPVLVDVGFVRLDSRLTATFAVCRQVIEEELASENAALAPNWEWRFLVPNLGPLSKKQESKFGPMLAFLKNATCAVEPLKNVGNGSLQNPVQVTLVDAPQVVVDASG